MIMEIKACDTNLMQQLREIQTAAENTTDAAADAVKAARRQLLSGLINRVEMKQSNMFSGKSWNKLMKAYSVGKTVYMNEAAEIRAINRAIREMTGALNAMKPAERVDKEDDERHNPLPLVLNLGGSDSPDVNVDVSL